VVEEFSMRIGITGTPGTGKSTSLKLVDTELDKIYLTEWCNEHYSKSGIEIEVDTDVLNTEFKKKNNFIVEGHLAHFIELDKLVILRCNPDVLRDRLAKRGYSKKKIMDNIE
jgi:adenylate kinase